MEWYKRGTLVITGWRSRYRLSASKIWRGNGSLLLGGVTVAAADEVKHFKLIGTTGTGKSTAIAELLRGALERGDRVIVADPDGGYLARFYDRRRGDVILNPFEPRSVKWDPFAEIHTPYDIEQLASGLIPSSEDASGREWRGYARTFLSAVIRRCHQDGRDATELWRLLAIASSRELRRVVAGTPAQPFLDPDNARMFASIRSVTGSAVAALAYVQGDRQSRLSVPDQKRQPGMGQPRMGQPLPRHRRLLTVEQARRASAFSVRDWVRAGPGSLFIPYHASQIAALRSIIATWMRLAIFEAMSRPGEDQHLWFVMDELDALGAIDGLKDALARLRKFGGRCVIGFQSIAQVSSTYGPGDAQTIIENCGNTLILRCSGSDHGGTSHFASKLIGEREIVRRQRSHGRDREGLFTARGSRRSTNISDQHVTEVAVLASELEQLPDLSGYLKTASSRAWKRVRIAR